MFSLLQQTKELSLPSLNCPAQSISTSLMASASANSCSNQMEINVFASTSTIAPRATAAVVMVTSITEPIAVIVVQPCAAHAVLEAHSIAITSV